MKFKPNDKVLVNGVPAYVIRHDRYVLPDGNTVGNVHVQMFDANRGWVEWDASESIVRMSN